MSHNHFRLLTLGRLALLTPAGEEDDSLGKQRRRLALLAVLALARPKGARRPLPRDVLVEMFWGDQDEARARHSLDNALSHLRRVLGSDAIAKRQADVALAAEAPLDVDAVELAEMVAAHEYGRAVALYGGTFLRGVHIEGSPRFEHWADGERRRLEGLFLEACQREALALARARRWGECGALAARWLEVAPLSTDAALYLLNALKAPGTRESDLAALAEYERIRVRLAREYELAPDQAVAALAADIATRLEASGQSAVAAPAAHAAASAAGAASSPGPSPASAAATLVRAETAKLAPPSAALQAPVGDVAPDAAVRGRDETGALPRRQTRRRAVLVAAGVAALVAPALWLLRPASAPPPVSPTAVAVFPFTVHGSRELTYLQEGMVDLLSTALDGAGDLRSTDPRAVLGVLGDASREGLDPAQGRAVARRLGARLYVLGDVVDVAGRLRMTTALYDSDRGLSPVVRASVEGERDSVFALVDGLTEQLLAGRSEGPAERVVRLAALTTRSLPALKAYLEGEAHWRAVRLPQAVEALRRAVAIDPRFALAWYRLGLASSWDARVEVARDAMERAVQHGASLSEHDQRLIAGYRAVVWRQVDEAERIYLAIVADYPTDVEAWAGLGEVWFHGNPVRGRSFTKSRQAWERMLQLEPTNVGAMGHLAQVAAREGRYAEFDSLVTRMLGTVSGSLALSMRAVRAATLGDSAARDQLIPELQKADDLSAILSVWRAAVFSSDLASSERYARLLTEPQRRDEVRALGHVMLAHLELAQGRWRSAREHLAAVQPLHPQWAAEYEALLSVAPLLPMSRAEIEAERERVGRWRARATATTAASPESHWVNAHAGIHSQLRTYLLGLLSARLGNAAAAERAAADLAQMPDPPDSVLRGTAAVEWLDTLWAHELAHVYARSIRAEVFRQRGRPEDALRTLTSGRSDVDFHLGRTSPFFALSYERFTRAELLRTLGRDAEALGWYAGMGEIYPYELVYLAPAHLRQGEIYEKLGQRAKAAEHYGRFLELWKDADPELRPLVREVERRQGRLTQLRGAG